MIVAANEYLDARGTKNAARLDAELHGHVRYDAVTRQVTVAERCREIVGVLTDVTAHRR